MPDAPPRQQAAPQDLRDQAEARQQWPRWVMLGILLAGIFLLALLNQGLVRIF